MLYLHVCMSISKLYHALCPQWACACQSLGPLACVVTSIPPEACLNLTTCENTSGVLMSSMHTFLCFVRCWYACLACFAPPIWLSLLLCIFARLPTCSCMSLCVVHIPIQWNYGHSIQTYICPPRTPSFFFITYLFVSSCASNVCLPPVCFIFLLCVIALYMVCVCVCLWEKVIMHFVWWTLMATWVILSSHECSRPYDMSMRSRQFM